MNEFYVVFKTAKVGGAKQYTWRIKRTMDEKVVATAGKWFPSWNECVTDLVTFIQQMQAVQVPSSPM